MAVSFVTGSAWAEFTGDVTHTLDNTGVQSGDLYVLIAAYKQQDVTLAVSGWTDGSSTADGTTASGNGSGSMRVRVFYLERGGSNPSNPSLDFTGTPLVGAACCLVFRKGAGEVWDTPLFRSGNWASSSSQTISASSTVAVPSSGAVAAVLGIADDSATFTRAATTGIDVASGITWNGNYVERPATHHSTTTGNDMAADAGYRLVTTGGTVTLRQTATLSAAETGHGVWIVLGVHSDTTVTPSTAALALTAFAPTVTTTANVLATPDVAALSLTAFAPTAATPVLATPTTATLTTATFAPTVTGGAGTTVTPDTAALTLATFAPTVATPVTATPATVALTTTAFAPTVSTPVLATPPTAALTLTAFAPSVSAPRLVTPAAAALTVSTFAPAVATPVVATPVTLALTLTTFAPQLGGAIAVTPETRALVISTFAPDITATQSFPPPSEPTPRRRAWLPSRVQRDNWRKYPPGVPGF